MTACRTVGASRLDRRSQESERRLMKSMLLVIVLVVIAVMTVLWAFGKVLWWLRVTFPPKRPRRRPR